MALKWLISKTKRFLPIMAVISFANAIYAIFSVVFALLSKGIIDAAIIRDRAQLTQYAVGMFVAILLAFIIRIFSNGSTEWMRARLEIQFRNQLLASMLQKEFTEVGKYHSGERMNRMMNDIQIVCEGVTTIVPSLVMLSTKGICAIIVLFILSPRFTIVFFVGGVIMIAVTAVLRGRMKALHKEVQEKGGVVRSFLQESLESILFVKVFSAQKKILYKAGNLQEDYFHAQMKRRTCSILAGAGVGIAFELAYLCALIMGAGGLFAETMTYGTLTAILQLVGQVQQPFVNLSGILPKYYSMLASAERVIEFEELPEELCIEKQNEVISFSKIVVRDLAFSYGRNTILKDMNLTINKGDFLSITGRSGEGKSTLFLLLLGAYQPSKGSLFLKQNNGEQIPIDASTRCEFSYVPQGNHLFSGTLRENILFLKEDASDQEIDQVMKLSCLEQVLGSLPQGLETVIGERGYGLSEGQAQRVAIARALLSEAPIILLDEATSALDEKTELEVLKNIASLREKTCLIVTHRNAAIHFCNRHIEVKDGELVEWTNS